MAEACHSERRVFGARNLLFLSATREADSFPFGKLRVGMTISIVVSKLLDLSAFICCGETGA